MSTTKLNEMAEKLTSAGLSTQIKGDRLYVSERGKPMGFLNEYDDGTTGTCKDLTRRAGYVAGLLRG